MGTSRRSEASALLDAWEQLTLSQYLSLQVLELLDAAPQINKVHVKQTFHRRAFSPISSPSNLKKLIAVSRETQQTPFNLSPVAAQRLHSFHVQSIHRNRCRKPSAGP